MISIRSCALLLLLNFTSIHCSQSALFDYQIQSIAALKRYKCTYSNCLKSYSRQYHLNRHINSVHKGKRYPCPLCKKPFTNQSNLSRHVKSKLCRANRVLAPRSRYLPPHCRSEQEPVPEFIPTFTPFKPYPYLQPTVSVSVSILINIADNRQGTLLPYLSTISPNQASPQTTPSKELETAALLASLSQLKEKPRTILKTLQLINQETRK